MKFLVPFLTFSLFTIVLSQSDSATDISTETTELSTVTTTEVPSTSEKSTTLLPKTTTVIPSTTSNQPDSTSVAPTTISPAPKKCLWNTTCIRAELAAQFVIPILATNSSATLNLDCGATAITDCSSNDTQKLELVEGNQYNLTLVFEKEKGKIFVSNITFNYTYARQSEFVANNDEHFGVKAGNSYLCKSESNVKLGDVVMKVSEIHIQAFGEKEDFSFGTNEECEADEKVSPIVPIAVGISLAALIIIVLIAYLVGRRRSRQRGYQSV